MASSSTSSDKISQRPVKKLRPNPSIPQPPPDTTKVLIIPATEKDTASVSKSAPPKPSATSRLPPPPEIVNNVQGSSSGAGSGEFHVYKASRRREYERMRIMNEEAKRDEDNERWDKEREELQRLDALKTLRNKAKRDKKKAKAMAKAKEVTLQNKNMTSAGSAAPRTTEVEGKAQMVQKNGKMPVKQKGPQLPENRVVGEHEDEHNDSRSENGEEIAVDPSAKQPKATNDRDMADVEPTETHEIVEQNIVIHDDDF